MLRLQSSSLLFRYALVGILFLFGCTPQLSFHRGDLKLLDQNPTVYVVTFQPAPFEVDTAGNVALIGGVLGGAVGGALGGAAGALVARDAVNATDRANVTTDIHNDPRALVRSIDYEDTVKSARDEFVARLRSKFKMSNFVIIDGPLEDESPESLSVRFRDGIVLGFKTVEWVLELAPLSSDFWIRYRGRGMFFLPREGRYLWRDLCGFIPKESITPLPELAANSGEGLKNRLVAVGRRCGQQLFAEVLEPSSR